MTAQAVGMGLFSQPGRDVPLPVPVHTRPFAEETVSAFQLSTVFRSTQAVFSHTNSYQICTVTDARKTFQMLNSPINGCPRLTAEFRRDCPEFPDNPVDVSVRK